MLGKLWQAGGCERPQSTEGKYLLAAGIGITPGDGLGRADLLFDFCEQAVYVVFVFDAAGNGSGLPIETCRRREKT